MAHQELFDYLYHTFDVKALESEMQDLIHIVEQEIKSRDEEERQWIEQYDNCNCSDPGCPCNGNKKGTL